MAVTIHHNASWNASWKPFTASKASVSMSIKKSSILLQSLVISHSLNHLDVLGFEPCLVTSSGGHLQPLAVCLVGDGIDNLDTSALL